MWNNELGVPCVHCPVPSCHLWLAVGCWWGRPPVAGRARSLLGKSQYLNEARSQRGSLLLRTCPSGFVRFFHLASLPWTGISHGGGQSPHCNWRSHCLKTWVKHWVHKGAEGESHTAERTDSSKKHISALFPGCSALFLGGTTRWHSSHSRWLS